MDALLRETMEESNMSVTVDRLYCVCSSIKAHSGHSGYGVTPTKVLLGFTCTYLSGEFKESDESTDYRWVAEADVLELLTAADAIEKYRAYLEFHGSVRYLEYSSRPFEMNTERNF